MDGLLCGLGGFPGPSLHGLFLRKVLRVYLGAPVGLSRLDIGPLVSVLISGSWCEPGIRLELSAGLPETLPLPRPLLPLAHTDSLSSE